MECKDFEPSIIQDNEEQENINNNINILINSYKKIDLTYRKTFWILFSVLNLVFSFYTILMLFGVHDFKYMQIGLESTKYYPIGRLGATWIKFFFNYTYVPLIYSFISFACYSFFSIALLHYWNVKKNLLIYIILGFLITLQPFTAEWLFYPGSAVPEIFLALAFIIVAFLLLDNFFDKQINIKKFLLKTAIPILLLTASLLIYPPLISLFLILPLSKLFLQLRKIENFVNLKTYFKNFSIQFICGILSGLFLKFIFFILLKNNIMDLSNYNIQGLPINQIPGRILFCIKSAFYQLVLYEFPFYPNSLTEIFTLLLLLLLVYIFFNSKYACPKRNLKFAKLTEVFILFLILIFTTFAAWLSEKNVCYEPRVIAFSFIIFKVFIIVALFDKIKEVYLKNFITICCIPIILTSITNDLVIQKVWKQSIETELLMQNRIQQRIESLKDFDNNKKYDVLYIGQFHKEVGRNFLSNNTYKNYIHKQLHTPYTYTHPLASLQYYYVTPDTFYREFSLFRTKDDINFKQYIQELNNENMLETLNEYPNNNSIIIYKNLIIIVFDKSEIKKIKEWIIDSN